MMFPAGSNMDEDAHLCTSCYEFEMDQMQHPQSAQQPWNDEMAGSDSESSLHERLRSSTGALTVRDYSQMTGQVRPSEIEGSDDSSEDESATAHERLSAKETLDNVFRLLQIEAIVDG